MYNLEQEFQYYKKHLKDEPRLYKAAELMLLNFNELVDKINENFEKESTNIRKYLSYLVSEWFKEDLTHYEHYYDGCPWDYSGDIKKAETIDMNSTLEEFLEEYTGNKIPTYTSYYGMSMETISDNLDDDCLCLGEFLMRKILTEFLENNTDLNESEIGDTINELHDPFYDNTPTERFFSTEGVIDYLEIDTSILTKDFVEESKDLNKIDFDDESDVFDYLRSENKPLYLEMYKKSKELNNT